VEAIMLNPTSLLADALGQNLAETYRRIYGDQEPHIASGLDEAARLVIERIASSDALYHDCQHTALVTLCVQDILRGRLLERTVTPIDWAHTILAALNHDIGYVRGICSGDTSEHFVIDAGNTVTPPRGARCILTPHQYVNGKIRPRAFAPVLSSTGAHRRGDRAHAPRAGRRRRPPPTRKWAGQGRRPIGQLGDRFYLQIERAYYEFVETGLPESR
jgi:hypothetical protein